LGGDSLYSQICKREERGKTGNGKVRRQHGRRREVVHIAWQTRDGSSCTAKHKSDQVLNFGGFCAHPSAHHDQVWREWVKVKCARTSQISA